MRWREVSRGLFELGGMPPGVLRHFSQRRTEIEERAIDLVGTGAGLSRERMQEIALATRRANEYAVNGSSWREQARSELGALQAPLVNWSARAANNGDCQDEAPPVAGPGFRRAYRPISRNCYGIDMQAVGGIMRRPFLKSPLTSSHIESGESSLATSS